MQSHAVESDELTVLGLTRRLDVDGLRAIAVAAVLGFHFFPDAIKGGFAGVDVFFVISGFVITNLLLRRNMRSARSLAQFWGHRLRRLGPAFTLVVVVSLALGWFAFWPRVYSDMGANAFWASLSAGNFYSWTQANYFAVEPIESPLLNLWSLGVEEQFYLVWPLFIVVAATWRKRTLLPVLVGLALLSWAAGLIMVVRSGGSIDSVSSSFYLPWFRAWELLAGAIVALATLLPLTAWPWRVAARVAPVAYPVAVLVLLAGFVPGPLRIVPSVYAVIPVLTTAVIIALGRSPSASSSALGSRVPLWLGRISYPLYLWHWPLLAAAAAMGLAASVGGRLVTIAVSVLAAWGTWVWVERPVQARQVTWKMVAALTAAVGFVALMGGVVALQQGFPQRLFGLAAELGSYAYDPRPDMRSGECFLETTSAQDAERLTDCLVPLEGKRNILLWGDSHAAHLYRGLADQLPANATLSQLTVASCLPSDDPSDASSPACARMNQLARQEVASGNYADVIISGRWKEGDSASLAVMLSELSVPMGTRVTVVGPDPVWRPSLPRAWSMFEAGRLDRLPQYSRQSLNPLPTELRDAIAASIPDGTMGFFDPLASLCRADGCLVRTGPGIETLTTYDYGHLTRAGSDVVARSLYEQLDAQGSRGSGS